MEQIDEDEPGLMEPFSNKNRARPKHMERILLANHKEQMGLQRRLDFINSCCKTSCKELSREKFKVNTDLQYTRRLSYKNIAPFLKDIPTMLRQAYPHPDKLDPVTVFLLREYRRNSQVIPDILSRLQMDEEDKRNMNQLRHPADEDDKNSGDHLYRNKDGDPDPHKLTDLVREITRIRNEIMYMNRIHGNRTRVTFEELLRYVQDREQLGSDSDTYTDGTCALLRRKMNRMRHVTNLNLSLEEDQMDGLRVKVKPPPPVPRFKNYNRKVVECNLMRAKPSVAPIGRVYTGSNAPSRHCHPVVKDAEMRRQLERQERRVTDLKVAKEMEEYYKIHGKITDFLEKNKQKMQLPFLYDDKPPGRAVS